jgi:hypothetical protein
VCAQTQASRRPARTLEKARFVYYPAHALDGVGGIEGSKNMRLF